jgi:hypothetical protein
MVQADTTRQRASQAVFRAAIRLDEPKHSDPGAGNAGTECRVRLCGTRGNDHLGICRDDSA